MISLGRKIIVLGCPGSGKSTLSKRLQSTLDIPLYHLDNIWWRSDRTNVSRDEFDSKLENILNKDEWIIDGDFSRTYERRIESCDTVIFLDFGEEECLKGIAQRVGQKRTDIPWVEDSVSEELVQCVWKYKEEKRPVLLGLFKKYSQKRILIFESRAQVNAWTRTLLQNRPR